MIKCESLLANVLNPIIVQMYLFPLLFPLRHRTIVCINSELSSDMFFTSSTHCKTQCSNPAVLVEIMLL